jgi:MamI restriction endonuclease
VKPEVAKALARHAPQRRDWLKALDQQEQRALLEELIADFFVGQRQVLLKWSALTGQSAQIDTGYIAQHMASVTLAEPGQGFKGKGVDLADGSEVKSAALLSGVDRPRWNHNMGTLASDRQRAARSIAPMWQGYLEAPRVFYVLFDRFPTEPAKLRVRAWCVQPRVDAGWRDLFNRYVEQRTASQYNLQLHPPIGRDDDLVVNTLGNLDFRDIKVFEAVFALPDTPQQLSVEWIMPPDESFRAGRTIATPYKRDPDRRIEIEGVDGHALSTERDVRKRFRSLNSD